MSILKRHDWCSIRVKRAYAYTVIKGGIVSNALYKPFLSFVSYGAMCASVTILNTILCVCVCVCVCVPPPSFADSDAFDFGKQLHEINLFYCYEMIEHRIRSIKEETRFLSMLTLITHSVSFHSVSSVKFH